MCPTMLMPVFNIALNTLDCLNAQVGGNESVQKLHFVTFCLRVCFVMSPSPTPSLSPPEWGMPTKSRGRHISMSEYVCIGYLHDFEDILIICLSILFSHCPFFFFFFFFFPFSFSLSDHPGHFFKDAFKELGCCCSL